MDIRSFKNKHDAVLRTYIKRKIRIAQKTAAWPRTEQLIAYIDDAMFAGGKRVRPYLLFLSYKLFGGAQDAEVMRFATSAELIHTMALIHDDIIDKGEMRHNKMCFHAFAKELYGHDAHASHLGMSQAILAGDLIFAWAYDVIYATYPLPTAQLHAAQKNMQEMIEEVTAGQMIDVDTMGGDHVDTEKLDAKNYYKSGAYTFCRPLMTGAMLAGVDTKTLKQLEKIGVLLGKAYQMRDDILDVMVAEGDDTTTYDNKTKFSDVQDGQQTYLTNYIYEKGTYAQRLALSQSMGKRLNAVQITTLRQVFQDSGAITYGKGLLQGYLDAARVAIGKLTVQDAMYRDYLLDVTTMMAL